MALSSVLQMYLGWANSILCEQGIAIDGMHQLQDGTIFCRLIEILTGTQLLTAEQNDLPDDSEAVDLVQRSLDYLARIGVKINVTAKGVIQSEVKSILDVMWSVILHCTIHSPDQAAYQRTVRIGRKRLLQWCGDELKTDIDINKSMVTVFGGNNLLSDLIFLHCSFHNDNSNNGKDNCLTNLENGILAAEDHLGISKTLLRHEDIIHGTADEHSLMIYIALLRRKVSMLMSHQCSLSSDEDDTVKISTDKQSANTSVLSTVNSAYNGYSQSTVPQHSTSQPPHGQFALPNLSFVNQKTTLVETSPRRQGTNQDVTSERSDSGISTSADVLSSPSSLSSCQPNNSLSSTSNGLIRDHRHDRKETIATLSPKADLGSMGDGCSVKSSRLSNPCAASKLTQDIVEGGVKKTGSPSVMDYNISWMTQGVVASAKEDGTRQMGDSKQIGRRIICEPHDESLVGDDELLNLLDTIGEESQHLRQELNETQRREAILKTHLEEGAQASTKEENVISKLIQELEMLRTENRRIFREVAIAKNTSVLEKKAGEKLNATIAGLKTQVEYLNVQNLNLKMNSRMEPNKIKGNIDAESLGSGGDRKLTDQVVMMQENFKIELAQVESKRELLKMRVKKIEDESRNKLDHSNEELRIARRDNLRLEKACKLLRMSNETSRLEVETVTGRCRRLEEYLTRAQRRNKRLTQQLDEQEATRESTEDKFEHLATVKSLSEENIHLKESVQLAEDEVELLQQELLHYRQSKTVIDEILRAWDAKTSEKFQSFLDDFKVHINEQQHRIPITLQTKKDCTQIHSARSTAFSGQIPNRLITDGPPSDNTDDSISAHAIVKKRMADKDDTFHEPVVDDKYLCSSPYKADSDAEIDSEMDSQTTEDTFSDCLKGSTHEVKDEHAMSNPQSLDNFRRPSLGGLIVAKSQNSPPSYSSIGGPDLGKLASGASSKVKTITSSLIDDSNLVEFTKQNPYERTRFSSVNSSMESLRGITEKAKRQPDTSCATEDSQDTQKKHVDNNNEECPAKVLPFQDLTSQQNDSAPELVKRHVPSCDPKSLPDGGPLPVVMRQRFTSPIRGRFSRWRRIQNSRCQQTLNGSYLGGTSDLKSQSNSLISNTRGSNDLAQQQNYLNKLGDLESETVSNSFQSEEEDYACLPVRHVAKIKETPNGASREKNEEKEVDDSSMKQRIYKSAINTEWCPSPQTPGYLRSKLGMKIEQERLRNNHNKEGQLVSTDTLQTIYYDRLGVEPTDQIRSDVPPANQVSLEVQPPDQLPPKLQTFIQNQPEEHTTSQNLPSNPIEPGNQLTVSTNVNNVHPPQYKNGFQLKGMSKQAANAPLSKLSPSSLQKITDEKSVRRISANSTDLSPASYNQFYQHKMLATTDQEYANRIIDKYLNHI